ncbi:MAG: hypothetical protein WD449_00805 [Candidatus Babeliales bacterium]
MQKQAIPPAGMKPEQITLLKMALEYLGDQNGRLSDYAKRVQSQVVLLQSQGSQLHTDDWVKMAKILTVEAVSRDIGAERIAETIYPLVDGSGQYVKALAYIPAPFATNQLLQFTGVSLESDVKQLLTKVISQLQRMILNQ